MPDRPLPAPTPTSQPFWDGLRRRQLLLQYSPSTRRWVYYPRGLAPGTLADDLEWREAAGTGTVYTFTVARRPTAPAWEGASPQLIAVVELDEGPKVTTELVDIDPDAIRIGLRVQAVFEDVPGRDVTLLKFAPLR
ncbi:MAG: acyl dehydratase [Dehalococcoidia bacterium]|nr:MAG: acyl dehydratase [Dehalococcoidia bacterium]